MLLLYCTVQVKLVYPTANIDELSECLVVIIGVISNLIIFMIMMACARLTQRVLTKFPDSISRFLLCYGFETLIDPLLILIVDIASQNWDGDAFKLYNLWQIQEGSGVAGVIFTLLIYACLTVASLAVVYYYLLKIHMNGRMFDIHPRLHSDDDVWHIPDDMEISAQVLQYIISKSYKWRGFQGTKRQIAVTKYTVRDHLDPTFNEETIHLAIYNVTLTTGERDMYRHFVKYHDGSIRELFEAEDIASDEDYVALEEKLFNHLDEQAEKEHQQQLNELKMQQIEQTKKEAETAAAKAGAGGGGGGSAPVKRNSLAVGVPMGGAAGVRSSSPANRMMESKYGGGADSKYGGTPVPTAAGGGGPSMADEHARLLGADPAAADSLMQPIPPSPGGGANAELEMAANAVLDGSAAAEDGQLMGGGAVRVSAHSECHPMTD